jgi:hypothetical protein
VGVDEYVYALSCLRTRLEGTDDMHDWGHASFKSSLIHDTNQRGSAMVGSGAQVRSKAMMTLDRVSA